MSTTRRIFDESRRTGIDTPRQGANLYDRGISKPEKEVPVNISNIPKEYTSQDAQSQDGKYGFVNQSVFGEGREAINRQLAEGIEKDWRYTPFETGAKYREEQISVAEKMGLPEQAGDHVWNAAFSSNFEKNYYTVGGQLIRSVTAGGMDLFLNTIGDVLDLGNTLIHEAGRLSAHVMSYGGEAFMGSEWGEQKREDINRRSASGPIGIDVLTEAVLGISVLDPITDVLNEAGDWYGTWDDMIDLDDELEKNFFYDEKGNFTLNYNQMLKPQFWYTKFGKMIPNLIGFYFAGTKISNLARTRVASTSWGAKNMLTPINMTTNLSKNVLNPAFKFFGHKGIGKMPQAYWAAKDVAAVGGAAVGINLLEGVMLAGEANRKVLDAGGTTAQAASASLYTMANNMEYMYVDAMKWMVMSKFVGGVGAKLKVNSAGSFLPAVTNFTISSGITVTDAYLEQVQETYQDWSVSKNAHNALGTKFEGKDKDGNIVDFSGGNFGQSLQIFKQQGGFWDYFNSPEAAETRLISSAMALGPGIAGTVGGAFKDTINAMALRSSILDEKINASGMTDGNNYNLLFAKEAAIAKEKGIIGKDWTPEQKKIIQNEIAKENFLLGVVAEREVETAIGEGGRIDIMVKQGQITKEQGQQYKETLTEMNETFSKFDNESLKQLTPQARKQLAEVAYYKDATQRMLNETVANKQAQIDKVKETIKDPKLRKQQIDFINKEFSMQEKSFQETITNYEKIIPQLYSDSKKFHENQLKEIKNKNKKKRDDVIKKKEDSTPINIKQKESQKKKIRGKKASQLKKLGYTSSQMKKLSAREVNNIIKNKTRPKNHYKYRVVKNKSGKYNIVSPDGTIEVSNISTKKGAENIAKGKTAQLPTSGKQQADNVQKEIDNLAIQLNKEKNEGKKQKIKDKILKLSKQKAALQNDVSMNHAEKSVDSSTNKRNIEKETIEKEKTVFEKVAEQKKNRIKEIDERIAAIEKKSKEQGALFKSEINTLNRLKLERSQLTTTEAQFKDKKTSLKDLLQRKKVNKQSATSPYYTKRHIAFEKAWRDKMIKKGVNITFIDKLMMSEEGLRTLGLTHGLSMFIDVGSANQETIFHEGSHIYLGEFWNSPVVKALRNFIVQKDKNGKFVNPAYENTREAYPDMILFKNKKGEVFTFAQLLKTQNSIVTWSEWKKRPQNTNKTISQYIDASKRALKGYKELPPSQQRYVLEETLADLLGKKLDEKALDKKISKNQETRNEAKNIIRRFWDFIKNMFTRKEAKEILEKTGNENLAQQFDKALEAVVKDYKNKEGHYYTLRKVRVNKRSSESFQQRDRSPLIKEKVNRRIDDEINLLKDEVFTEEMMEYPYYENGQITPAGKKKLKAFIIENKEILNNSLISYFENEREQLAIDYIEENWNRILNEALLSQSLVSTDVFSEDGQNLLEEELEVGTMDAYMEDKRSGEGETLSAAINEYTSMENLGTLHSKKGKEDRDKKLGRNAVRRILYNAAWESATLEEFKLKVEQSLINLKENNLQPTENAMLARFANYLAESYIASKYKGSSIDLMDNVINDMYHELNAFKNIDFYKLDYRDGKPMISPHRSGKQVGMEKNIRLRMKNDMTISSPTRVNQDKSFDAKEISKLRFLSNVGGLYKIVNNDNLSLIEKRRAVAEFLYHNIVPANYKDSISPQELEKGELIDSFIPQDIPKLDKNGKEMKDDKGNVIMEKDKNSATHQLIRDTGIFIFNGKNPESIGKKAILNSFQKWSKTRDVQENFSTDEMNNLKELVEYSVDNSTYKGIKDTRPRINLNVNSNNIEFNPMYLKQGKPTPRISHQIREFGIIKKLSIALAERIAKGEFLTQVTMPNGEKTNLISKKHQIDILMNKLDNLTPAEMIELEGVFGDNALFQKIKNGERVEVVQMIGGLVNNSAYNSGSETSNQRTMMDVSLLAEAISGKSSTYSQNISIFSDKSLHLRINNADLLSPSEAWAKAEEIHKKGDKFLEGDIPVFDLYDKQGNKLKKEIQSLDKFIRSQPKELISKSIQKKMKGDKTAYNRFLGQIVLNYAINKYHAKDLLIGPAKHFKGPNDYIKRSAGSVAMHVQWDSNSRIEPIMLKDVKVDGVNKTDACSFITESMARKMVKNKYGGLRKVGDHYKFVYNGQNLDNKTFSNKAGERFPFYGKTNVFVLTDNFILKNPNFKSVRDSLDIRDRATPNNVMPVVMFSSSIKNQSPGIKNNLLNVNDLSRLNKTNEDGSVLLNDHQNGMWKDNDIYGLDGSFFGIQTELDKKSSSSTIAKQILFHLNSIPADIKNSNNVQQLWVDAFKSQVESILAENFISGEVTADKIKKVSEKLAKSADTNVFSQAAIDLLATGSFDNGSVDLRRRLANSILKKKALRMRGKGGVTYQSTDFGVGTKVSLDNISTNDKLGLRGYKKDGKNYKAAQVAVHEGMGLKIGEKVILQRVPASKLGDAVVGEVTQIIKGSGSMVMIPSEISDLIGSDLDGDALHVISKHQEISKKGDKTIKQKLTDSQNKYNKAFDATTNLMLSEKYHEFMIKSIGFDAVVKKAKNKIESKKIKYTESDINDLSIINDNKKFRSNREGQKNIGRAALFNTLYKVLSSYELSVTGKAMFRGDIKNAGLKNNKLDNNYLGNKGRGFNLAYMLNIFLDDANKGNASELNMNTQTFNMWSQLLARGMSFDNVAVLMNSDIAKDFVEQYQNSPESSTFDIVQSLLNEITDIPFWQIPDRSIDLNNLNNESSKIGMLQLIVKLNNSSLRDNTNTLGALANLDSSLPETGLGVADLIRKVIQLSHIHRDNVMSSHRLFSKTLTQSQVDGLLLALKNGDMKTISESINLKHPILQKNFNILLKQAETINSDPAYAGDWRSVMRRVLAVNASDFRNLNSKDIIGMENTVRSIRLAQSGIYNFSLTNVFGDYYSKNERVLEELNNPNTSFERILNLGLNHIDMLSKGDMNGVYSFINNYCTIEQLEITENIGRGRYLESTGNTTKVSMTADGVFAQGIIAGDLKNNTTIKINDRGVSNPESARKAFEKLPARVKDFLLAYDLISNQHTGPTALLPYLGGSAAKVSNVTKSQLIKSKGQESRKGKITAEFADKVADHILVNNKNINKKVFIDASYSVEGNNIVRNDNYNLEGGNLFINNEIYSVDAKSKIKKSSQKQNVTLLYKANISTEGKVTLTPIASSFTRDKRMPSRIDVVERDMNIESKESNITTDEVFPQRKRNVTHKTLATIDGKEMKDTDGMFVNEEKYLTNDEIFHQRNNTNRDFQEYVNSYGTHVDLDALKKQNPKAYKKVEEQYQRYQEDIHKVAKLEQTYFSRDENGISVIEDTEIGIDDMLSILKNEINNLDPIAAANIREKMNRALGAKMHLSNIKDVIKAVKDQGFSQQQVDALVDMQEKLEKGHPLGTKDISWAQMWLDSNISSSERGEISFILNELNKSEMHYYKENRRIRRKMDKAYNKLLKSRLNWFKFVPWFVHKAIHTYVPYGRFLYNKFLFKNLVEDHEVVNSQTGKYERVLRFKNFMNTDGTISDAKVKNANLTEAEINYLRMYVETTGMFENHLSQKTGPNGRPLLEDGRGSRYIPNMAAGKFEMMINRNMTAAFIGHNYDSKLRDIAVVGEMDGVTVTAPLGQFVEYYKLQQMDKGKGVKDMKSKRQLKALFNQANRYVKGGKDALGNPIILIEDIVNVSDAHSFDRNLASRSSSAEFSASSDIHNNLTKYVNKTMWAHGLNTQSGFSFRGMMEKLPLIDGAISYTSFRGNPFAQRWIKDLLRDRYVLQKTARKSIFTKDGKRIWADKIADNLQKWTMFVGLGFNITAAVGNIAIGKYNTFRRGGIKEWGRGESRFWGIGQNGIYSNESRKKATAIAIEFGIITDATEQLSEGLFDGGFGKIMFAPMSVSEKWIQRVGFVGQLTQEEWNSFTINKNGEVEVIDSAVYEQLTKNADRYKSDVYAVQGRGYTALDQRLIQTYSFVNTLLQFKRWLPTFIWDRWGGEKIDRFNRGHVGSTRATISFVRDIVRDKDFDVRKWKGKFKDLPKHRQEAIAKAARGTYGMIFVLGLISMIGGFSDDDDESGTIGELKDLFWDMNLMMNIDKWQYLMSVPALDTGLNVLNGLKYIISGSEYQRDTKYFKKGTSKAMGTLPKLFPKPIRKSFER